MSFYIRFDKAGRTVRFDRLRIRLKGQDVQHLTLEEFAEHLRVHGGDDHKWGDAILDLTGEVSAAQDELDALERESGDANEGWAAVKEAIEAHVPTFALDPVGEAAGTIERAGNLLADIRVVLVERGALANDDTDTDIPALIGALLS